MAPFSHQDTWNSNGRGRDSFITFANDREPPHSHVRRPIPPSKLAAAKPPVLPRFQSNGDGRDMYCQVQKDQVVPHVGVIDTRKPAAQRKSPVTGVVRTYSPSTYVPTGSGRDLFFVNGFDKSVMTSSHIFRVKKTDSVMRARTSPPPRFVSSGSGRDSFQNPHSYKFSRSACHREQTEGFAYGSQSVSRNARYRFKGHGPAVCPRNQKIALRRLAEPSPTRRRPLTAKF